MQPPQMARPVLSGEIPPLAEAFRLRQVPGLEDALAPGDTVVLAPGDHPEAAGWRGGGTGKTQLAAAFARARWARREIGLLLWVQAGSRDGIISSYAQALTGMPAMAVAADKPELAAARFLAWLAQTTTPWLIVFDDLTDPADADDLWPRGPSGQVLVTTENHAPLRIPRCRTVPVAAFSMRDATAYLSDRLGDQPGQRAGATDLAIDLHGVPLTLSQAAAYIVDSGHDCDEYRLAFNERRQRLADRYADASAATLAAVWTLALERADRLSPTGMAGPALALSSMLGPDGIPAAVLTSQSACAYVTGHLVRSAEDEISVRTALSNLARLGLVTIDASSATRTVRMHGLLQAAVRRMLVPSQLGEIATVAADSVRQAWPEHDGQPGLDQALRDCTASIRRVADQLLWNPESHPLLLRAGQSLDAAGLAGPAVAYWQGMVHASMRALGARNPRTLQFHDRLASACEAAGRADVAVGLREQALAIREEALGSAHSDTLAARASLARAYDAAGLPGDAMALYQRTVADCQRFLGPAHAETVTARANLASACQAAGRSADALALFRRVLADREQALGSAHPDTLAARASLGHAYHAAGQVADAVELYQRLLADRERVVGADHLDTLNACGNLAYACHVAGRRKEALVLFERTLAGRLRLQGPDNPGTVDARANLAAAYCSAGKVKQAIPLYEQTLADRVRVQGPEHEDTLAARGNLAAACHAARRLQDAISGYEHTLADCERILGSSHTTTLTTRGNLAHAYHTAGRLKEALAVFERTLTDCEQVLRPDHPLTVAVLELRQRYLAGRYGAAPIIGPPRPLPGPRISGAGHAAAGRTRGRSRAAQRPRTRPPR